ncbi:glycoside hydrolase family 43 protein [Bombilactobacillus bombi]|uniref:glycoside hydrolase family 43 protein n=1 Tax=Bombilactobacillus bombi TaxID=1303590 RepID=UPI002159E51F|nr:glycoside hydrolase family 43 protein [Bombilactobacillus bombi]
MNNTYQNPIVRGMYPDPSMVQVDGTYYLANSTFEYYPGIAISQSQDLVNWQKMPGVIRMASQADLTKAKSNEGIFAVNIRYHQGYFYVITTNFSEFKTILIKGQLSADHQQIIWENQRVELDIQGIDPDLYFEAEHVYVQFTGYIDQKGTKAIQQVEIDLATGQILQKPKVLTLGTGGRDVEGPHIIKKNEWYYLLMAEGGTGVGHMITMQRSHNLWGPYQAPIEINPLFTNRDRAEEPLQNIGHADLFQDTQGNWWLTCLGTRPSSVEFSKITNTGRETLLYPVIWHDDWPHIYQGVPTQTVNLDDFPDHAKVIGTQKLPDFVDNFSTAQLNPEWLTLRANLAERLELTKGHLILTGSNRKFEQLGTPSFIGIRQTEPQEEFEISLDHKTTTLEQGQAGIVSLINADHYIALMIEYDTSTKMYQFLKVVKIADVEQTTVIATRSTLPQQLLIKNYSDCKQFIARWSDQDISFKIAALHLSNEAIAALNTGDVEGLYAVGTAVKIGITQVQRKLTK